MKTKLLKRVLLGFPLGVFINTTITLLISLGAGGGAYWAVVPQLTQQVGSEVGAVALQYLLSGILGAACCGGSVVWEMESWSLLRQTLVHYCIIAGSMFPIAWLAWWMPHTLPGALLYFAIFLAIYAVIFLSMFLYWRQRVRQMNTCLQNNRKTT